MPTSLKGLAVEATENVYRRLGEAIHSERARRLAQPCIMAEEFRLRRQTLPRWRWLARAWCRNRWRVWAARCRANQLAHCLEDDRA